MGELTSVIDQLAATLADTAITVGDLSCWLAPCLEPGEADWRAVERTGDPTLYDGSAGIAAACVAVATSPTASAHRTALVDLAVTATRHALGRAPAVASPGLLDGRCGIALAALSVGAVADEPALTAAGRHLLAAACDDMLAAPSGDDLVSGLSGLVVALGRAGDLTGDGAWSERALAGADVLVARGRRRSWGLSWASEPADASGEPDLCGLAHGTSGALLALAVATGLAGGSRYAEPIALARRYERSWFDPVANGWPDLRGWDGESLPPRPARWCHGATGIGVSRLALAAVSEPPDPAVLGETAVALQATFAESSHDLEAASGDLGAGLTVCHGLGGALDLLVEASIQLDEGIHREVAAALAERAVAALGPDVARWPGGVRGHPGPGLMNGAAGAMWVLTRVVDRSMTATPGSVRLQAA
jgi:lantibiotic modifying enzyme